MKIDGSLITAIMLSITWNAFFVPASLDQAFLVQQRIKKETMNANVSVNRNATYEKDLLTNQRCQDLEEKLGERSEQKKGGE